MIFPLAIPTFPRLPLLGLFRAKLRSLVALAAVAMVLFPNTLSARSPIFYESDPIELEIERIKATLQILPVSPTIANPWSLGYASAWDDLPESSLTIEIKFPQAEVIDLVAILPAVHIDDSGVRQTFGFPVRFSLERLLPDGTAQIIADHLDRDYPELGMSPQLFPCPAPVATSGLRITVTRRAGNPT